MIKNISISELTVGMFVERVVKQSGKVIIKSRGIVSSSALIDTLVKKGIEEVEVDFAKSKVPAPAEQLVTQHPAVTEIKKPPSSPDIDKAHKLYAQAKSIQKNFIKQLRAGNAPDFSQITNLSQDIIDSVFDNGDALACLMMLKSSDDYLVEHAINCSILLAMFAQYKGFSQADTEDLTQAGLFMDLGMASLPSDLLDKEGSFSAADWNMIRSHIDIGYELVERFGDVPSLVLDVIANHHEREDGSGYPRGKNADQISIHSKMAAIVDSYDAMISNRSYSCSQSATEALQLLEEDTTLNTDLVTDFINAIGLHPVGSLLELASGNLAMVTQRNPKSPLKPTVMSFYSVRNQVHTEIKRVDLSKANDKIIRGIRPEEFSLNLAGFFKKVFLPVR